MRASESVNESMVVYVRVVVNGFVCARVGVDVVGVWVRLCCTTVIAI